MALKPGEYNNTKVKTFNGISVTLLRGALGPGYRKDWTEEQIEEYEEWLKTQSVSYTHLTLPTTPSV